MTCNNCGCEIPENENFCQQCGTPVAQESYQPEQTMPVDAPVGEPKSKMVAGLLAIFLGTYGVHNFYLGFTKKAVIQLVVSLAGLLLSLCTIGISCAATVGIAVWAIVEGIQIFTGKINADAKGIPLKD